MVVFRGRDSDFFNFNINIFAGDNIAAIQGSLFPGAQCDMAVTVATVLPFFGVALLSLDCLSFELPIVKPTPPVPIRPDFFSCLKCVS
ncbi:hypothetical protein, partial [Photorhabdus aegyptia]|uniref:hypothetical protein n=1 Tax=Photorhabdus aegyptia TaxID=2805098 RepID=UPI00056AAA76